MNTSGDLTRFAPLLNRAEDDPLVVVFLRGLGPPSSSITSAYLKGIAFKPQGIGVTLKEEEWLVPPGAPFRKGRFRVEALHFNAEGHEGYSEYRGALIDDVRFSDHRLDVRRKLGYPSASGGGNPAFAGKVWALWDRYDLEGYSIRIEYAGQGEQITVVTLMMPPELGGSDST